MGIACRPSINWLPAGGRRAVGTRWQRAAASLQEEANAYAAALAGPSAGMSGALLGEQAALHVSDSRVWGPMKPVLILYPLQCPTCLRGV